MTPQEQALVQLACFLDHEGIPYVIIGGMANAAWGNPRATLDVDVTVWLEPTAPEDAVERFASVFKVLPQDPRGFVRDTRVLPLETDAGTRIDVVFGLLPFEQEAVARGVLRQVAGQPVRFCTAEDLVLLKIVSDRPRDLDDVQAILHCNRDHLDRAYLAPRVEELAQLLENPDILDRYRRGIE